MTLKEQKAALRKVYKAKREALPEDERRARDVRICETVLGSASYRYASTVLAYAPIGAEIDIFPLILSALDEGKQVALPKTHGDGIMTFHYIASPEELVVGGFGIREPRRGAKPFEGAPSTLMLVPGIVFDEGGRRIGYGGGYYDRFLRVHKVATLGLVYRDFILPALPYGRYDRCVAALATEAGIKQTQP